MEAPDASVSRLMASVDNNFALGDTCPQFQALEPRLLLSAISDDFSSPALDTDIWQFIDPVGDSQLVLDGTNALITVGAGVSHDVWKSGNNAPRLMQLIENEDFEVEVKFESRPEGTYCVNGIIIEQDGDNFLRFDFHSSGSNLNLFAASFDNGAPQARLYIPLSGGEVTYMRVSRQGNTWTQEYSYDGQAWTFGGSFQQTLNVSAVGPFVGNEGSNPPAYTGSIDYFFNTTTPIDPEDGPEPDVTPPQISDVSVELGISNIQVSFETDETATTTLEYGLTKNYELGSVSGPTGTAHNLLINSLQAETTYHMKITAVDESDNVTQSPDYTATTKQIPTTEGIRSDDFSNPVLSNQIWQFIDPVGDSEFILNGTNAFIAVPAGVPHDIWEAGNRAPRLMQPAENEDFEIEVKFESQPEGRYAVQGIIIEQDRDNFLRLDFHSSGSNVSLFAASFTNDNPAVKLYKPISVSNPIYMRISRLGDLWTQQFSSDGESWIIGGSFTHSLNVTSVGAFVGNEGSNPPEFTGSIDYFFNTASRIEPEDSNPDTTPPEIQNISIEAGTDFIQIDFATDEPTIATVEYGLTENHELGVISGQQGTTHSIRIENLHASTTYQLRISAVDTSGNVSISDNVITTAEIPPDTLPPAIQNITVDAGETYLEINFVTNEPAIAVLDYGLTTQYELGNIQSPEGTAHSIRIESLQPDKVYNFKITTSDPNGNTSQTQNMTASTNPVVFENERVIENLVALYTFKEGGGDTIHDISGVGNEMNLIIDDPDKVKWSNSALSVNEEALIATSTAATKLIGSVQSSSEITIEAWITPANVTQDGPARIISLSLDAYERNFTLGQGLWGSQPSDIIDVRFRSTETSTNGQPSLTTPAGSISPELSHVVYTRDSNGTARIYVNNTLLAETFVAGDLSNWDTSYFLSLANEFGGSRPWFGTFYLAAFYSLALTTEQVDQNYLAGVNQPPKIYPIGNRNGEEDSLLQFTLSAIDPDGEELTYSAEDLPAGAILDNGVFTWTPNYEQAGIYNITFSVSDGTFSDSEAVTLTIANTNRSPFIDPVDSLNGAEASLLQFSISAADPDGDPITYSATDLPDGAVFDETERIFTWTPNYEQAGIYNVTFSISDGTLSDTETISVDIANTNRPPVLDPIGNRNGDEDSPLQFSISATDPDGDPITYSAEALPDGAVFDETERIFTWTPNFEQAGTYEVTFIASDGALSGSEVVTIEIANTNRPPEINPIGEQSGAENTPLQFSVSGIDPDNDQLTYSSTALPEGAQLNETDGTFTWTPNYEQAGTYNITFIVSDTTFSDSEAVTLTIANTNRPPILDPLNDVSSAEDSLVQFTVSAIDPDGDPISYSAGWLPYKSVFNGYEGTFTWTPNFDQAGTYEVTFSASDGILSDSKTITIYIANINRPPEIDPIAAVNAYEQQLIEFVVSADDPDEDALDVSANNLPEGASFEPADRIFSWTPTSEQSGNYEVTFIATDGDLSTNAACSIFVADGHAPVLEITGSTVVENGQPILLTATATDVDNDELTISVSDIPSGAVWDPQAQTLSWQDTAELAGVYPVLFEVSDGYGTVSKVVDIKILGLPVGYTAIGQGYTNAYYIDNDRDGYGVASIFGPDADDNDPEVNTWATVEAKYGDLETFVRHKGYDPNRIIVVNPGDSYSTPQPGDMIVFGSGTGVGNYPFGASNLNGTADAPIVFMAMPGEKVIWDSNGQSIGIDHSSYLVFDGFICTNTSGYTGNGVVIYESSNITLRNIESSSHSRGISGMQDLQNITLEFSVFRDNVTHGIYLGARDLPNSNITVRNCLSYGNGYHGFQHNGRVTNLLVESNIIQSNKLAGISLIEGVSYSEVRNNLVFNNAKQGIVFYAYDDTPLSGILPYDQTNNLVINNTVWVGYYDFQGNVGPEDHAAVLFNDATKAQNISLDNNVFQNNIFVTYSGTAFQFNQEKFAQTTTVENNIFFRQGDDLIMSTGGSVWEEGAVSYDLAEFEVFSDLIASNNFQQPLFSDVSTDYFAQPEKFDFGLLSASPAINFGTDNNAPLLDLRGSLRDEFPDAGCFELS